MDQYPMSGERVVPMQMQYDPRDLAAEMARYLFALEWCQHKRVLDCSCGTGYGTEILSYVADFVLGVDIAPDAVAYARENYSTPRNRFVIGDAMNLMPLISNMARECDFDVVASFETIEHLAHPGLFIQAVWDTLEPGGLFIASAPENSGSSWHVRDFTRRELLFVLTANRAWSAIRYFCQGPRLEIIENGEPTWGSPTHIFLCTR